MKDTRILGIATGLALVLMGLAVGGSRTQSLQASSTAAVPASQKPSTQEINDAFVQQITKKIAGHEQEPAGQVFKNIQLDFFKKTPAERFLLIMNQGYSRALGVTCEHCHAKDDFSSDDKRPKRCARDMALMHFEINQKLAKMQNLEPNPNGHFINCTTCHRGHIDPLKESN